MRLSVLAFVGGVVCLQMQATLPAPWLLALGVALAAPAIYLSARCRPGLFRLVSLCAAAVIGFAWAGAMAHWRLAEQLPEAWEAKEVQLSGVVASLPQRFERGERFVFDVKSVDTPGALVPSRIMLSWYGRRDDSDADVIVAVDDRELVHPGERWVLTVRLKRPHGNANPHGFDYEAWLLERGILATGTVASRRDMQRLDAFVWHPVYLVERTREQIRDRFLAVLPDAPYVGVLTALAVGDQRAIPAGQWQVFNRTGVTHLVSISGLHVTMVAALCAALINALWRRNDRLMLALPAQKAAVAAGWLAAFAYALLAGFEVPAQRTLFMLSVVALALWSGRNFGASRILLLAMFVVLLRDPWAVMATGFWLSFGAVAVLLFVGSARFGQGDGAQTGWRAIILRWGAGTMGGDAGQPAPSIAVLPAIFAGVAAGQCRRDPRRQFYRDAAGPDFCRTALATFAAVRSLGNDATHAVARRIGCLAGLAAASATVADRPAGPVGGRLAVVAARLSRPLACT